MAYRRLAPILATVLLWPSVASADSEGESGKVVRLTINTQASTKYASFHGSITVKGRTSTVYSWGGSMCPAQKFSEDQVELLAYALAHRDRIGLVPIYRKSQGTKTRCLVSFELTA